MKKFVFVIDNFDDGSVERALGRMGLEKDVSFHVTGTDNCEILFMKPEWLNSDKLIVFVSSFAGDISPSITFAKRVKSANSKATVILRSMTETSANQVFDDCMLRRVGNHREMQRFINQFFSEPDTVP